MHLIQFLALALWVAASPLAQSPSVPTAAFGVTDDSGVLRAGGPAYSATFDTDGCEFTPLLGARAPRTYPLRCSLAAVRRGQTVVYTRNGVPAQPQREGTTIRYLRTSELVERYDVGSAGIEQSFVLATRPAGSGELVVELDVATDLALVDAGPDQLAYSVHGLGRCVRHPGSLRRRELQRAAWSARRSRSS